MALIFSTSRIIPVRSYLKLTPRLPVGDTWLRLFMRSCPYMYLCSILCLMASSFSSSLCLSRKTSNFSVYFCTLNGFTASGSMRSSSLLCSICGRTILANSWFFLLT